ncbi:DUF983 domain-containing protein [Roseomonas terrae]|jgi:uncharacterized protein (DUF983 family)|uniref:DUF983 domain-containing protein n=1 Tax=Neoroseomonas terrae TaxID=424799 RepID=A0ABS5ED67_9PROT|nr:DUF983 domain-containing protein [Neoroseomonas terrae]MBR0648966.1 DUF983 domain-containing protein [Neoroseomonas terrae]
MPWDSQPASPAEASVRLPVGTMLVRGAMGRCPVCGRGRLFNGYLRLADECSNCHEPLGRIRADDAPPYFTILIVGHVLVPFVFMAEKAWYPPMWLHMALWLPLFAVLSALFLRPIKGAVVAWMLRLGLTGTEHGAPIMPAPPREGSPDA